MEKDTKNTNLYKDALMDICKRQKLPEMFEKLIDSLFNRISINGRYNASRAASDKSKPLKFNLRKAENFPGEELVSETVSIVDERQPGSCFGNIYLTFHEDKNRWTQTLHLFNESKSVNKIVQISSVEVF